MKQSRYDIFISYRRDNGAQYARTLQLMLEKKGYKVFLDYDELVDGPFSQKVVSAIKEAPIYIIILTKDALDRCVNEGDWVRREFEVALEENRRIIPINPDNTFDGIPEATPTCIKNAVESIQHSDIYFGQTLKPTVDLMVKNRIDPYINRNKKWKKILLWSSVILFFAGATIVWKWKTDHDLRILKESITFNGQPIEWADKINRKQLFAVEDILSSMRLIEGGNFTQGAEPFENGEYHKNVETEFETPAFNTTVASFYISQFEVNIDQWNTIMNDNRKGDPDEPLANVTYNQAKNFAEILSDLTTMDFRLPTETEWEYAAKGGNRQEGFMFAGSNNPSEVAWYQANSKGHPHSDTLGTPTINDLFNMSGNVSEWCDTPFEPYDKTQAFNTAGTMVVRGGNYDSQEYEITTTHREPVSPETSIPTLGFRIALSK